MQVITVGQKGKRPLTKVATDHFEKMLEASCLNHHYSVTHAYKDCGLLSKSLSKGAPLEKGAKSQ
jgi:hypothetical protein